MTTFEPCTAYFLVTTMQIKNSLLQKQSALSFVRNEYMWCNIAFLDHHGNQFIHIQLYSNCSQGRHGCERMVVGFTATCAISAYHY